MRSELGGERHRSGSGFGFVLIILLAAGIAAYFLFKGNASITKIDFSGLGRKDPICFLELEFHKYPKEGDLKDVKVVFSCDAIEGNPSFDWTHIGANAMRNPKKGFGREVVPGFAADKDPLLGIPISVGFPLTARQTVEPGKSFLVLAELYWAGKKQDTAKRSLRYMYKKEN